ASSVAFPRLYARRASFLLRALTSKRSTLTQRTYTRNVLPRPRRRRGNARLHERHAQRLLLQSRWWRNVRLRVVTSTNGSASRIGSLQNSQLPFFVGVASLSCCLSTVFFCRFFSELAVLGFFGLVLFTALREHHF